MNQPLASNIAEYTVSELSSAVKRTVEESFGYVRLRGEISGFRGRHSSGHAYFALKDDKAKIDAVVWKGTFAGLRFKPEEGMEVVATGRITTFPGKSSYQIVIESLEPAGIGALMALLEERKKKLAAEGLFDEARKRPLPFLPAVVGIVTSPTGAVIQDMLHGFAERFPACVLVWPVRVQGDTCAAEVAAAVEGFNRLGAGSPVPRPDVLIVARGGGSLEDLWGFNEEIVARAVAESRIPVISAVGHETDWTLIDFVADARAPTPTKAAEWAVPKHSELVARMSELSVRRLQAVTRIVIGARSHLRAAARGLPRPQDLIGFARQRFDGASGRLAYALRSFAMQKRARLGQWQGRLDARLIAQRAERCHDRLGALDREMRQVVRRLVQQRHVQLGQRAARLRPGLLRHPAVRGRERLGIAGERLAQSIGVIAEKRRRQLASLGQLLRTLSHKSVLDRGFALVRDLDGQMIRSSEDALAVGRLELEFSDGRVVAETESDADKGAAGRPERKAGSGKTRADGEKMKQGKLF
jgi:exodeoxyribonuclease VII large subunit